MREVPSLFTETKTLLDVAATELSLRQIAVGAGVGLEWLRKLKYDTPRDVGVLKVEKLHRYLKDYEASKRFSERAGQ